MQRRTFLGGVVTAAGASVLYPTSLLDHVLASGGDGVGSPPFDFSDSFYRANGIDSSKIHLRPTGTDGNSVIAQAPDPDHSNVRVTATTGGFDADGNLIYYNVLGEFFTDAFTNDSAGQSALSIANTFTAFHFPRQSGNPLDGNLPNRRQDNVFDTRHGYFSNDPLGLWTLGFVIYTSSAFNTSAGQSALSSLASTNGTDTDGTPIIKKVDEIESLASSGFVTVRTRPTDGSQGGTWRVCPVINPPTGGAITRDAFLNFVKKADGTPLIPVILEQFKCLQQTGNLC